MKFLRRSFRGLAGCITGLGGVAFALSLVAGPMKPGPHTFTFAPPVTIWDISGDYALGGEGFNCQFTLNVDSAGKITGSGTGVLQYEEGHIEARLTYKGMIKSAGKATRVMLTLMLDGSGQQGTNQILFNGSLRRTWEIDAQTGLVLGRSGGKLRVGVQGAGSQNLTIPPTDEVLALPGALLSNWQLEMNLQTNLNTYAGHALLRLANDRTFPLLLGGNYTAKRDSSSLTTAATNAPGIRITLATAVTNSAITLRSVKGTALGQKLSWTLAP